MKYKYKIDYKSIGGSSSISSTSSSASSDNTLGSTTFDDKIKYIDNIIDNLGYEEGNIRLIDTRKHTPQKKPKRYDPIQIIKKMWADNVNLDDRINKLLTHLEHYEYIIENFNIFNNVLLRRAVKYWFKDKNQAITIYGDISDWDTSYVTEMNYLFFGRSGFNEDISKWDTSNVTNMEHMFKEATSFNQNIGSWDTSNVTDMSSMFKNAKNFNGDISTWDTSNVKFMDRMFEGAESFNQNINTKPIKNSNGQILYTAWNVSNVAYLSYMFLGATSFNGIVSDWTLDPSKYLNGTSGGLDSGLNITLYLKNLEGKIETIIINPFFTVRYLKKKLFDRILLEQNKFKIERLNLIDLLINKIQFLIEKLSNTQNMQEIEEQRKIVINNRKQLIENLKEEVKEIDKQILNEYLKNKVKELNELIENLEQDNLKENLEDEISELIRQKQSLLIQHQIVNELMTFEPSILTNKFWYPKIFFNNKFDYKNDESKSKEENRILRDRKYGEYRENLELSSDERQIFSYGVKNGDKLNFTLASRELPDGISRFEFFNN